MSLTLVMLFAATITCDVAGQLFFKIGADRLPHYSGPEARAFFLGLVKDWWLLAGILAYVMQLIVWLQILSMVPLSIAFPMASVTFLGVALASRVFLAERISRSQGMGALLIAAGVAVVAGMA